MSTNNCIIHLGVFSSIMSVASSKNNEIASFFLHCFCDRIPILPWILMEGPVDKLVAHKGRIKGKLVMRLQTKDCEQFAVQCTNRLDREMVILPLFFFNLVWNCHVDRKNSFEHSFSPERYAVWCDNGLTNQGKKLRTYSGTIWSHNVHFASWEYTFYPKMYVRCKHHHLSVKIRDKLGSNCFYYPNAGNTFYRDNPKVLRGFIRGLNFIYVTFLFFPSIFCIIDFNISLISNSRFLCVKNRRVSI